MFKGWWNGTIRDLLILFDDIVIRDLLILFDDIVSLNLCVYGIIISSFLLIRSKALIVPIILLFIFNEFLSGKSTLIRINTNIP